MKPRTLFVVDGIIALVSGIVFVILPGLALSILGVAPRNSALQLFVAFLGACLIANGGFQVLARDLAGGAAGVAFMRANLVFDVVGVILALIGVLGGIVNTLGLLFVVLFLVVGTLHLWWGFLRPAGSSGSSGV